MDGLDPAPTGVGMVAGDVVADEDRRIMNNSYICVHSQVYYRKLISWRKHFIVV